MDNFGYFLADVFKIIGKFVAGIAVKAVAAAIVFAIGYLVVRAGTYLLRKLVKTLRVPMGLRGILISLGQAILWTILMVIVLSVLGFGSVIIFLSTSLVAVGLVMAAGGGTLISDILAGIFLADNKNFKIGDKVRAGENETEGVIEGMDIRRIEIRSKDGKLHVLPNSVVERKEWVVLATKAELAREEREKAEKAEKAK